MLPTEVLNTNNSIHKFLSIDMIQPLKVRIFDKLQTYLILKNKEKNSQFYRILLGFLVIIIIVFLNFYDNIDYYFKMERNIRNSIQRSLGPDQPTNKKIDGSHSKPFQQRLNIVEQPSQIVERFTAIGRTPNIVINYIKYSKNESEVSAPIRALQNKLPSTLGSSPTRQCVTEGSLSQTQYQALMVEHKDIILQNIKKTHVQINALEAQLLPIKKKIKELLKQKETTEKKKKELLEQKYNQKMEKEKLISQMYRLYWVKASQLRSIQHEKRIIQAKLIELGESKQKSIERISLQQQNQDISKHIQQMNEKLNKMDKDCEKQKIKLNNIQNSLQLFQAKESDEVSPFKVEIDRVITQIQQLEIVRQPFQAQIQVLYKQLVNYSVASLKFYKCNVLPQEN